MTHEEGGEAPGSPRPVLRHALRHALRDVGRLTSRLRRVGYRQASADLRRAANAALAAGKATLKTAPTDRQDASRQPTMEASGEVQVSVPSGAVRFLTEVPPGHFYSPVPDADDVSSRADGIFSTTRPLPGIDLNEDGQLSLFRTLAALARESPLEVVPGTSTRYGIDNPNYGVGDASMLQAVLRHFRPRRYLEVGSGFTTALALDVRERFLGGELSVTAVEPYPELLRAVIRPDDQVEVLAQGVQDVRLDRFRELEANDVLFIDCSHVAKVGSDVVHLYTQVLPVLAEGVIVHVHDIFWPFEYLRHWVEGGRAWNEAYLLHAFLLYNDAFEILLWNHFLATCHRDVVEEALPAMLENPGGAIWLRRTRRGAAVSAAADRDAAVSNAPVTGAPVTDAPVSDPR